jgi:hypothetical protein
MKKIIPLFLILAIQGCATSNPPMYEWGHYEDLIYQSYAHPDKMPPEEHIAKLQADYEVAKSKNRPVPPGYYAQLGVLYFKMGKLAEAKASFASEQALYPESKQYMTRIIDKIK